jgi:predicted nucleotidyltransferase
LKALLEELNDIVEKIKAYGVKLVVLYGSMARGDYTVESDIDILIVADNFSRDPRDGYEIVMKYVNPRVHPVCLNTDSFRKLLENESTFILEILEDGKILYSDKVFLEETLNKYREIRKKWTRRGKTWIKNMS